MANKVQSKCLGCGDIFTADVRNRGRQKYCPKRACRAAGKAARQRRWLAKPENRDYFREGDNAARAREWQRAHPGYWRNTTRYKRRTLHIDSDHHIDHHRASVWCLECDRIVDVEDIPKLEAIEAEFLAEEQRARGTAVGRLKDKVGLPMSRERRLAHKRVMSLRLKKEWLRQRFLPPRCLSCGSTEIVNVDWENNGSGGDAKPSRQMFRAFRHPCGGRLVLTLFQRNALSCRAKTFRGRSRRDASKN
jgi:hypothetical protein